MSIPDVAIEDCGHVVEVYGRRFHFMRKDDALVALSALRRAVRTERKEAQAKALEAIGEVMEDYDMRANRIREDQGDAASSYFFGVVDGLNKTWKYVLRGWFEQ